MSEEITWHLHHLIPKHLGGTDTPSNIVKVNVAMHAFLHKCLYEEYGHEWDRIAWQGLAGLIGHDEVMKQVHMAKGPAVSAGLKKRYHEGHQPWNKGLKGKYNQEYRSKISDARSSVLYLIRKPDGSEVEVRNLIHWCKDNNAPYRALVNKVHNPKYKNKPQSWLISTGSNAGWGIKRLTHK